MDIQKEFSGLNIIIDNIEKDKNKIVEKWLEKEENKTFSKVFDNTPTNILKVFAGKILEHQFDIISKNKSRIFDTVTIIMDYFLKSKFTIVDIYYSYSNLKNVTLLFYIEKYPELKNKFYYPLANLFDKNYVLFMNEFLIDRCSYCSDTKKQKKLESKDNIEISKNKTSNELKKQSKKDIRFTKREIISAAEFTEDLDYTVFDKVESILEQVDDLVILMYSLDDSNDSKKSLEIVQSIEGHLDEIPELLISLGIFEIIERSFIGLIEFLSTITEEMLVDKDKKSLLVNLLLALINDFENWLKIIFINKSAQNIHYFDASFRANILKIENIFTENYEEENEECEIDFF